MLEQILQTLKTNNVFLTGGAGVGKSYTTNKIIDFYKQNQKNVAVLASTALAANVINGKTVHSFFSLGICTNLDELKAKKSLKNATNLKQILPKLDLIIIDEISMLSASVCEMIDFRLKQYDYNGKIMLVGDFYQLPPVNKEKDIFANVYAFESSFWAGLELVSFELEISKRTDDEYFYNALKLIRKSNTNANIINYLKKFLKPFDPKDDSFDDYTIICATNKEVDEINKSKLDKLDEKLLVFSSKLSTKKDPNQAEQKLISSWLKGNINYDDLHLKVGARVIFSTNSSTKDFYNGEQGRIVDIEDNAIAVLKDNDELVYVKEHEFALSQFITINDKLEEEIIATLKAYPLKLAYAITIHKSQGMSIEKLVCKIDRIFENGQFYVAISRASNPQNLIIYYERKFAFNEFLNKIIKKDKLVNDFYKNLNPIKSANLHLQQVTFDDTLNNQS